jgi:hypothetical protein
MSDLTNALSNPPQDKTKLLGKLVEMLERKNIDIAEIGDVRKVKLYQSLTKDAEGEAQIMTLQPFNSVLSGKQVLNGPLFNKVLLSSYRQ